MKSLLIRFVQPQTHCESLSIIVAPEWFLLRPVIMETARTGGNVTSDMCVCVCYLQVAVACGDSSHISAVYWNIAGTCLCPEVFNGYLRASAGSLWVPFMFFFLLKCFIKVDLFLFLRRVLPLNPGLTLIVGSKWRTEQWNRHVWLVCSALRLENGQQTEGQTRQLEVVTSANLSEVTAKLCCVYCIQINHSCWTGTLLACSLNFFPKRTEKETNFNLVQQRLTFTQKDKGHTGRCAPCWRSHTVLKCCGSPGRYMLELLGLFKHNTTSRALVPIVS